MYVVVETGRRLSEHDNYYLDVRCDGGWAGNFETPTPLAVFVELTH
jgi:hypothetical protein